MAADREPANEPAVASTHTAVRPDGSAAFAIALVDETHRVASTDDVPIRWRDDRPAAATPTRVTLRAPVEGALNGKTELV